MYCLKKRNSNIITRQSYADVGYSCYYGESDKRYCSSNQYGNRLCGIHYLMIWYFMNCGKVVHSGKTQE